MVLTLDELEGLFAMIDERSEILVGTRGVILMLKKLIMWLVLEMCVL